MLNYKNNKIAIHQRNEMMMAEKETFRCHDHGHKKT